MGGLKVRAGALRLHSGARVPGIKERALETEHSMGAEKEQTQEASAAPGCLQPAFFPSINLRHSQVCGYNAASLAPNRL